MPHQQRNANTPPEPVPPIVDLFTIEAKLKVVVIAVQAGEDDETQLSSENMTYIRLVLQDALQGIRSVQDKIDTITN